MKHGNLRFLTLVLALALVGGLAACSSQNKYEREADKITRAVIANDMTPVVGDFAPSIKSSITRVKVAEYSDELNAAGAYQGLKEDDKNCPPAFHCFDVKFAKAPYRELLQLDDQSHVTAWYMHAGAAGSVIAGAAGE